MLQRIFIHLSLILLFAFTQMGVATHEISHLTDSKHQQQQDQKNHENQCEQCLSYSHAADAGLAHSVTFQAAPASHTHVASDLSSATASSSFNFSARAPPHHSQT